MENSDGFIPIAAIFYAVFHPTEGTKIVHQVPHGSISTVHEEKRNHFNGNRANSTSSISSSKGSNGGNSDDEREQHEESDSSNTFFHFDTVKNYVIPKPQLCNKLISFKINKFRVIGYPVNIENDKYSRNSFNFNFCFVFPYDSGDVTPYESAIKRMGKMFQVLEEQNFMLSKLDKNNSFFKKSNNSNSVESNNINIGIDLNSYHANSEGDINSPGNLDQDNTNFELNAPGHSRTKRINLSSIESLINQIYQDLNNYSECCIPLDSANSVDIKLFPILPPPINLKAYQVPIATVKLNSLVDVNWDPTMVKILPYINGLNSVKRISELADANYLLTKQCIQHLMHYKCIEIIDIFQFGNIYAPTNHIGNFLRSNGKMAEECQAYVITGDANYDTPSIGNTPIASNSPFNTINNNSPYTGSILKKNPQGLESGIMNSINASVSPFTKQSPLLSKSPKTPMTEHLNGKQGTTIKVPSKASLFFLYRSLNQGQTVKEWYIHHRKLLVNIDIRRFINFGVLRGIIYRVHSYPLLSSITRIIEGNDLDHYYNLIDVMRKKHNPKKKLELKPKANEGNLLKTRVNEQTLKTSQVRSRRKVSFNQPSKRKVKDMILESENESDSDNNAYSEDNNSVSSLEEDASTRIRSRHSSSSIHRRYNIRAEGEGSVDENALDIDADSENQSDFDDDEPDSDELEEEQEMINLIKMLKGYQCFDSMCSELQKSKADIERMIEKLGSYSIVNS